MQLFFAADLIAHAFFGVFLSDAKFMRGEETIMNHGGNTIYHY